MRPSRSLIALIAAAVATPAFVHAAPILDPANGHYYDFVPGSVTFDAARDAAASDTYLGLPGHLAIFEGDDANYNAEESFVYTSLVAPQALGSRIVWVGASREVNATADSHTGWVWVDGSPVGTRSAQWNIDYAEGNVREGIGYFSDTNLWDYDASNAGGFAAGYIVEYQSLPEPAAATLLTPLALLLKRRR